VIAPTTVSDSARGLRRELGVFSLVLTQILYVVGGSWVGVAASVGQAHIVLWVAAVLLFFLPLALVVAHLASLMPLEGGVYRWAETAFGPFIGFFVAWNLWAYTVVALATIGEILAGAIGYALNGTGGFTTDNPAHVRFASFAAIGIAFVVVAFGLKVGKWVHGLGGAGNLLAFGALILVPLVALASGTLAHFPALALVAPAATLYTVNVFGKIAFGGFSGFEYIAIMAGECRDPARTIVRSVWISTPIIVAMFVLGTGSVLALVPHGAIDFVAPIPQTLRIGLGGTALAANVASIILALFAVRLLGVICLLFAGSVRLPMVAAWQGQAPGWLGTISARFGSPVYSALLVGGLAVALIVASQFGTRAQEAFQLLDNASNIHYALAYLAMFAIPILGRRELRMRIPLYVRVAAASGFVVTAVSAVLSIVPIISVTSRVLFAAKILGVVALFNLIGLAIYLLGRHASGEAP
jgi:amino acid transporter